MKKLNIAVTGGTGSLGAVLTEILVELGHTVTYYGRSASLSPSPYREWRLGERIPLDANVDLIFHLAFDYSTIKNYEQFFRVNVDSLLTLVQDKSVASKIILPLSLSGKPLAQSHYGKVKFEHEKLCNQLTLRTLTIGWLDSPQNGGPLIQFLIRGINKLPFNCLPKKGEFPIYISDKTALRIAILKLLSGEQNVIGYQLQPITLKEFIFGSSKPKYTALCKYIEYLLKVMPMFYLFLPARVVRVFDSARSLI